MNVSFFRSLISSLSLLVCFCFLIALYLMAMSTQGYQHGYLAATILIVAFILFFYFSDREDLLHLRRQYLKVSNLFLIGFCIVHFQFYIDLLIGYNTLSSKYVINSEVINRSAAISAIALCCFCLGYVLKAKLKVHSRVIYRQSKVINLQGVKVVLMVILSGVVMLTPMSYFKSGYISVELPDFAASLQNYFVIVLAGYLMLCTRNSIIIKKVPKGWGGFIKQSGLIVFLVASAYSLLVIMSGDRGPVIKILLAYVGSYLFLTRKKYSFIVVVSVIVVAATAVSALGYVRHLDSVSSPMDAIAQVIYISGSSPAKETISSGTEELARSVRTVHAAVDYTDENGFSLGYYKVRGVIGLVPGLGRLLVPFLDIEHDAKSTNLLTEHIGADHGMGTSAVADVWIDFGLIGVMVVFFCFGYFIRVVDVYAYSHLHLSIFWCILVSSALIASVGMGRGAFLDFIRSFVFAYILVLAGVYLHKIIRIRIIAPR